MGPSLAVEGSTTKEVFEAYLEIGSPSRSARRAGADHGQAAGSQAEQDEGVDRPAIGLQDNTPTTATITEAGTCVVFNYYKRPWPSISSFSPWPAKMCSPSSGK